MSASAPVPVMVIDEPPVAVVTQDAPMVVSELVEDDSPFAIPEGPPSKPGVAGPPSGKSSSSVFAKAQPQLPLPVRMLLHMVPVGVLFVCALVLLVHDIFFASGRAGGGFGDDPVDERPFIKLVFDEGRGAENYSDSMKFAVHKLDPDNKGAESVKLNWYDNGLGNSTVAKIDGNDFAFGFAPDHGKWALGSEKGKDAGKYGGKSRTFEFSNGIFITQTVTIEPSEPIEIAGKDDKAPKEYKRLLNMCLVRYKIHNKDPKRTHNVGLRVLMDTCIGLNDGVPFTLPGVGEVVSDLRDFKGDDVPDFVQVLEKPSLRDPGIVLQLNLRFLDRDKFDPPSRFQLTRYPTNNQTPEKKILNKWEVASMKMEDDSSVVIYWDPKDLGPGKSREVAFTYGLGSVSSSANGKLGLTVGGATHVGGELTVLALVDDQNAKTATLKLPPGLRLIGDQKLEQEVKQMRPDAKGRRPSPVTWRVRADGVGRHDISVSIDTGPTQSRRVTITASSLFN